MASATEPTPPVVEADMPFLSHLRELRTRLIRSVIAMGLGFVLCYSFAEKLFERLSDPVTQALPAGSSMVFLSAVEPFFTMLKLGALGGFLLALPVIFWQVWLFIAPGLYPGERRMAIPFVFCSCLCFFCGTYFGFTFVFPVIFSFLVQYGTSIAGINASLSIGSYLSLSTRLLLAFGCVFELPIIIFFLARMGVVDYTWLAAKRKFALVAAFIFGALLTPPDVFSQTAIALPFVILYEIGIWVARFCGKKPAPAATEEETAPPEEV